jgi:flagellin-like hook-associated protein FlgL
MTKITDLATTLSHGVKQVEKEINEISTALATGRAPLNPGNSSEVTRLSSQVNKYKTTEHSLGQVQNVINVAQTGLVSAVDLLQQMESLANQAASGTLSGTDMDAINTTFTQLASQIANIGENADVNGQNLLNNSAGFSVMSGITTSSLITIAGLDLTAIAATCTGLSITSVEGAYTAITTLTSQLSLISAGQSTLSAATVGIKAYQSEANALSTGLQATIDSIYNIDPTALQARLQQLNNQQSIDYYLVTQMNQQAAAVLTIFR